MDMDKFKQDREKRNKARKEKIANDRVAMLKKLNEHGITKVTSSYEGYGDSGNVIFIDIEPKCILPTDDWRHLENLVWDIAYNVNPGFDINDGGNGDFTWDIPNDRINISHTKIGDGVNTNEEHQNI